MESIGQSSNAAAAEPEPEDETPKKGRPIGTCEQMSPEAFVGRPEAASDVFSFVVVFCELVIRSRIFYLIPGGDQAIMRNRDTGEDECPNVWLVPQRVAKGERAELPEDKYCPPEWRLLMEVGWAQEPQDRPEFRDICAVLEASDAAAIEAGEAKH